MRAPSGATAIASNVATSPALNEASKSFLTPTVTPFARTGSTSVRSTVRPPGSPTSTISFACSGRVLAPSGNSTDRSAWPLSSV